MTAFIVEPSLDLAARLATSGRFPPIGKSERAASHRRSKIDPKRPFAVRARASLMKLITDIVGDTEDAAGSLSSQAWKPSKNRAEIQHFYRLRCIIFANTASTRRLTVV